MKFKECRKLKLKEKSYNLKLTEDELGHLSLLLAALSARVTDTLQDKIAYLLLSSK